MSVKALLYSADAPDQTPDLGAVRISELNTRQLLWVDLSSPTTAELEQAAALLDCDVQLMRLAAEPGTRPNLANYGTHFRVTVAAVKLATASAELERQPLTLIAGPNFVLTVHKAGIEFLDELRRREKGDSTIGSLSAESFVASLLDWMLNSYFNAIEVLVSDIDRVEVAILGKKVPRQLLEVLVTARKQTADLRRLLKSHRDVFYGLSRPDFTPTEHPDAKPHFDALNQHFERAQDDVDHARDLVIGSFELLTTRATQKTNETMRALTFVTVLMGSLALVAGVLGMNFALPLFETGMGGFVWVVTGMLAMASLAIWVAKARSWI